MREIWLKYHYNTHMTLSFTWSSESWKFAHNPEILSWLSSTNQTFLPWNMVSINLINCKWEVRQAFLRSRMLNCVNDWNKTGSTKQKRCRFSPFLEEKALPLTQLVQTAESPVRAQFYRFLKQSGSVGVLDWSLGWFTGFSVELVDPVWFWEHKLQPLVNNGHQPLPISNRGALWPLQVL